MRHDQSLGGRSRGVRCLGNAEPHLLTSHLKVNAMKAVGVQPSMLHQVGVPRFRHLQ
jgi:hypothetical protein